MCVCVCVCPVNKITLLGVGSPDLAETKLKIIQLLIMVCECSLCWVFCFYNLNVQHSAQLHSVCKYWLQAHLLACVVQCVLKSSQVESDDDEEEGEEDNQADLEDMLESLTRRMIKCELEDFELVNILYQMILINMSLSTCVSRISSVKLK